MTAKTVDELKEIIEQWYQNEDGRYEIVIGSSPEYRAQCLLDYEKELEEKYGIEIEDELKGEM